MFIVLFFLSAHILTLVLASSVSVLFPLNSQLPPIARVGSSYSWKFAESSFLSQTNASLVYSTSPLPAWLTFDPANRTFSGTPAQEDEGTPRIKVLATDPETSDSAASSVSLCITPYPAPDLAKPVASQFSPHNPSLSSVFLLSNHSALTKTEIPTLRIPSSWSFSIGFDGNTFTGSDGIRYAALQADGTPLPPWMRFDPNEITLDGVAPPLHTHPTPYFLELVLHASDQFGFSAASVPFNMVIASRELHSSSGGFLPTINITKSSSFDIVLNSPIDFAGVLVDDAPIEPHDVASVLIDTSSCSWLHYDTDSRRLTGQLPNDTMLPVVVTTIFNQTLDTRLKLAAVPSFFSEDPLPPLLVAPGDDLRFSLPTYFSNATQGEVADLIASYDPSDVATYLSFDTSSGILSGTIPASGTNYSHLTVFFTAYSRLTHSISHTSLPVSLTSADYEHGQPAAGSEHHASRKRLALGLGIALGLLGGIFGLSLLLAALRGCAHPPDPALTGAAAARAMTENERRWYGIGQPDDGYDNVEKGYTNGRWGELGLGLSRTMTRVSSGDDQHSLASPGQLSKAEFLNRIRSTVRKVSNRYRPANKSSIGRPVLVQDVGDPRAGTPATPAIPSLAGYEPVGYSGTASSLRGSPSSSTGERSIPQRRADFAPPRPPQPTARRSRDSVMSLASDSSTRSHAAEAVVQRAARARSLRSVGGHAGVSEGNSGARARMVPFTAGRATAGPGAPPPARASSLSASVVRVVARPALTGADGAGEADELDVGMRYVQALGEDAIGREASGSFSSLESSHPARSSIGSGGRGGRQVLRVLVRVGERFRFRLPVRAGAGAGLVARRVSGELMPAFLYADLDIARGDRHRDTVKFWGVPRADDIGEVHVGVYTANGVCVAQAVIEVLVRSS